MAVTMAVIHPFVVLLILQSITVCDSWINTMNKHYFIGGQHLHFSKLRNSRLAFSNFNTIMRSAQPFPVQEEVEEVADKTSLWSPDRPIKTKKDFDYEEAVTSIIRVFKMIEPVVEKHKNNMPLPSAVNRIRELLIIPDFFQEALARRRVALRDIHIEGSPESARMAKRVELACTFLQGIIVHEKNCIARDKLSFILNRVLTSNLLTQGTEENIKNQIATTTASPTSPTTAADAINDQSSSSSSSSMEVVLRQSSLIDECFETMSLHNSLDADLAKYLNTIIEKEALKCGVNVVPIYPEKLMHEEVSSEISEHEKMLRVKKYKEYMKSMGMSSQDNEMELSSTTSVASPIASSRGERFNDQISDRNDGRDSFIDGNTRHQHHRRPPFSNTKGGGEEEDKEEAAIDNNRKMKPKQESELLKLLLILRNRIYLEMTKNKKGQVKNHSSSGGNSEEGGSEGEDDGEGEKRYAYEKVKILARATSLIPDDIRKEYLETVLTNRKITYEFMKFAEEGSAYLKHLYEKANMLSMDSIGNSDVTGGGGGGDGGDSNNGDISHRDRLAETIQQQQEKKAANDKPVFDTLSKVDLTLPASRAFRLKQANKVEIVALQAREILQKFQ
jgi:hypothetical protein